MTNENDHAETVHCFWICVQDFANLTFYAETECTVPSKATLLWEFVRRFYQWTRYAVLSKSAALSLKYVQNVYTCPEKDVEVSQTWFISDTVAQQSQTWLIVKHLDIDLTRGVISDAEVNNIGRP